jgi:hypothetical protein
MTRKDIWLEKGNILHELHELIRNDIDGSNSDLILDFIENREYDVALDWIISVLGEENIR